MIIKEKRTGCNLERFLKRKGKKHALVPDWNNTKVFLTVWLWRQRCSWRGLNPLSSNICPAAGQQQVGLDNNVLVSSYRISSRKMLYCQRFQWIWTIPVTLIHEKKNQFTHSPQWKREIEFGRINCTLSMFGVRYLAKIHTGWVFYCSNVIVDACRQVRPTNRQLIQM